MSKPLPSLHKLVSQLQRVPYLASKNMYRVAAHFLQESEDSVERFCATLLEARKNIRPCVRCYNWTEEHELCAICVNPHRNQNIICVVETWHDLIAIERAQEFKGVYHVLGGALCPLNGIGPDELHITALFQRITPETTEIIFGTNPTPEGEATASFIASKIARSHVAISKLASGVPIGSSLEYMDRVTIHKALLGRRPF